MGWGGGGLRILSNEYSCTHHVTWSPNKLGRSNSIPPYLTYAPYGKLRTWERILLEVGGHVGPGRRHRRTVGAPGRIELDKGPPAVYMHPLIKIRRREANNRVRIDRMDRCNSEHKYSHTARGRHCVSARTEAYSSSLVSKMLGAGCVNSWHCVCFLLVHLRGSSD